MGAGVDREDPEPDETKVGGSLYGSYRTTSTIGVGAMASVHEAVHVGTGELVALKVLLPDLAEKSEVVSRFVREGRALQNLTHPNIVRVFDHGLTADGTPWIAMERLKGAPLAALIRDERKLPARRAVRIAAQVAAGLSVVHQQGIVHRDIKPENIFIVHPDTAEETAKLIDFGIARVSDREMGENSIKYTSANSMLGTVLFAPPEQVSGGTVDARADVFSLGVTLYEMLTGSLPFGGSTMQEQIRAQLAGNIVPLKQRLAGESVDRALDALVARALAREPAKRPENGAAMERELTKLAAALGALPVNPAAPPHAGAASPSVGEPPRVEAAAGVTTARLTTRVASVITVAAFVVAALVAFGIVRLVVGHH